MSVRAGGGGLDLGQTESQWHDYLRLFLIAQVVLGHIAAVALPSVHDLSLTEDWVYLTFRLVWRFGAEAAYLFVFLSGFMVAGPLFLKTLRMNVPPLRGFAAKRLRRIVPVSLCALVLTLAIDRLSYFAPNAKSIYATHFPYDMVATGDAAHFVGNALFLQPVFVNAFGSNGPLWTLGYIVQYYFLGWALCRIWAVSRILAMLGLPIALVLMAWLSPEWAVLFVSWLAGGCARLLTRSPRHPVLWLMTGSGLFVMSNLTSPLAAAALSIPVGALLSQSFGALRVTAPMLGASLRRLSTDSYVVYAVHYPLLVSVFVVLFSGELGATWVFWVYLIISLGCVVVATVGVGWAANRLGPLGRRVALVDRAERS